MEGDADPGPVTTGTAGTSVTGAAGTSATGAAGTSATGAAGTSATGAAGTSATGAAGTSDTGAAGTSATGAAGTTTTGAAGTSATGAAGTTATGAGGAAAGGKNYPTGMSAGCGMPPAGATNAWITKMITVTVPAAQTAMFGSRRYYLRLPTGYDPAKAYPLIMWGQGCGLTNAENTPVTNANATNYIHVLMQQVGGCFSTGAVDAPDIAYFDAVLKEVQANNCTDKARVFVGGYSSGSWMSHMIGCHRATSIRGVGSASGGINGAHSATACSGPVAAIITADTTDTTNPIVATDSATGLPKGSAAARDRILKTNGCSLTETKPWDPAFPVCVAYQNCNPLYPVVWCPTTGMGHSNGGMYSSQGFWKFWSTLPP